MEFKMEKSWGEKIKGEFDQVYFKELMSFVEDEYNQGSIFPEKEFVFRAFNECPLDKVKVVILGQDPYPTRGHAHGLCFSCDASVFPLPKSLKNIFKEYESDLNKKMPLDGDLSNWAKQGVLLLNTVLTVKEWEADSHKNKGWEKFTDAVIQVLNENTENIVYILWGAKAQKKGKDIDENKNLILKSPHPSPLSSYRGFFGSQPFSKTNEYLVNKGIEKINW